MEKHISKRDRIIGFGLVAALLVIMILITRLTNGLYNQLLLASGASEFLIAYKINGTLLAEAIIIGIVTFFFPFYRIYDGAKRSFKQHISEEAVTRTEKIVGIAIVLICLVVLCLNTELHFTNGRTCVIIAAVLLSVFVNMATRCFDSKRQLLYSTFVMVFTIFAATFTGMKVGEILAITVISAVELGMLQLCCKENSDKLPERRIMNAIAFMVMPFVVTMLFFIILHECYLFDVLFASGGTVNALKTAMEAWKPYGWAVMLALMMQAMIIVMLTHIISKGGAEKRLAGIVLAVMLASFLVIECVVIPTGMRLDFFYPLQDDWCSTFMVLAIYLRLLTGRLKIGSRKSSAKKSEMVKENAEK